MSEDRVEQYVEEYLKRYSPAVARLLASCESPIERLFLSAALGQLPHEAMAVPTDLREAVGATEVAYWPPFPIVSEHMPTVEEWRRPAGGDAALYAPHVAFNGDLFTWLVPQFEIESGGRKMRIDFAMFPLHDSPCPPVAIELDGHDFHERTKEQAERDKSRDRLLQAAGWQVLRFTGSEVWRDPKRCVLEAQLVMFWEHVRREPAFAHIVKTAAAQAKRTP